MFEFVLQALLAASPDAGDSSVDETPTTAPEPAPSQPGGFGSVSEVSTESTVVAPSASEPEPEADNDRRDEVSGRVAAGYGQSDVRNLATYDHQGAALGGVLQWYPYVTPRREFGIGIELGYAYQGMVRRRLPEVDDAPFAKSKIQEHFVGFGLALLLRPELQWFSIQPSVAIGASFFGGDELYARDSHASLPGRSVAFAFSPTLALCTAWDIICVVGGHRWTEGLDARRSLDTGIQVPTRAWSVGLGFDILRTYARLAEAPSGR